MTISAESFGIFDFFTEMFIEESSTFHTTFVQSLEILYVGSAGNVLSILRKHSHCSSNC